MPDLPFSSTIRRGLAIYDRLNQPMTRSSADKAANEAYRKEMLERANKSYLPKSKKRTPSRTPARAKRRP